MNSTEAELLDLLRRLGAERLRSVRLRDNRRTIWSLTQGGTVLNLHSAFGEAPRDVFSHFAVIANEALARTPTYRKAAQEVRNWQGLEPALLRLRSRQAGPHVTVRGEGGARRSSSRSSAPGSCGQRRRRSGFRPRPGPCVATPEQGRYLRELYRLLNELRFDGRLPTGANLRLSSRMRSRLGQMVPGRRFGIRSVVEIALNADLMLEGNGSARIDTLLHEMAHAAEWLFDGTVGHGEGWRQWARRAGCRDRACTPEPILRRPQGITRVTRVPTWPDLAGLRSWLDSPVRPS